MPYHLVSKDDDGSVIEDGGFFQTIEVAEGVGTIWERMGALHVEVRLEDIIEEYNDELEELFMTGDEDY